MEKDKIYYRSSDQPSSNAQGQGAQQLVLNAMNVMRRVGEVLVKADFEKGGENTYRQVIDLHRERDRPKRSKADGLP